MKKLTIRLFKCKKCNHHFSSDRSLSNHMHFQTRKLDRKPRKPLSWFSSSDEDEVKSVNANNKGKGLVDLEPGRNCCKPWPDLTATSTWTTAAKLTLTLEECMAAWSLVFLSRDSWVRHAPGDEHSGEGMTSVEWMPRIQHVRSTCGKAFSSPPTLVGHQACHAKDNLSPLVLESNEIAAYIYCYKLVEALCTSVVQKIKDELRWPGDIIRDEELGAWIGILPGYLRERGIVLDPLSIEGESVSDVASYQVVMSGDGKIVGFQPTSRVAVNHWASNPLTKLLYRGRKISPGLVEPSLKIPRPSEVILIELLMSAKPESHFALARPMQ